MRVMMDFDLSVQKLRECLCSEVLIGPFAVSKGTAPVEQE